MARVMSFVMSVFILVPVFAPATGQLILSVADWHYLNAMAMEPLGYIAGLGSALIGSVSTLMSVAFGVVIADAYNQTVLLLVAGFALPGLTSLVTMRWTESNAPVAD